MELQNPLNKPNRFAYGKDVTIINDNPPADQTFGVHKSAEQSGISVTLEESHFMIWKLENGIYVEFGEVNQKSAIVLGWTDGVDGYYFQSLTPTPKLEIRITGVAGNIIVDSDPSDGIGEGSADLLSFNGQINQGSVGQIGKLGEKGDKGDKGEAGGYATSFDGPHSLGDDRSPTADLGTVTVDTGLSYQGGEYVLISMVARPDSFDIARVTSYDSSTGVMSFDNLYQSTSDSESTDWNINLTGIQGEKGDKGEAGEAGVIGVDGAKGDKGDQGAMGIPGLTGQAGQDGTGFDGAKGEKGEAGLDGTAANQGQKGDKGDSSDMGGTMTASIIPDANEQYDLGSAEYKIRHLFLSDNSMYIGDTWIKAEGDQIKTPNLLVGDINLNNEGRQNEVDGTSGHWSIQEGSDDLFLINRNTGKKYKFNLTEM